jgi:hypothetical protein
MVEGELMVLPVAYKYRYLGVIEAIGVDGLVTYALQVDKVHNREGHEEVLRSRTIGTASHRGRSECACGLVDAEGHLRGRGMVRGRGAQGGAEGA